MKIIFHLGFTQVVAVSASLETGNVFVKASKVALAWRRPASESIQPLTPHELGSGLPIIPPACGHTRSVAEGIHELSPTFGQMAIALVAE